MYNKVLLPIRKSLTWDNYAGSMYGVLRHGGMLDPTIRLSDFIGMTGSAFQFIVDGACTYWASTKFHWSREYEAFLGRVGVKADTYFAMPDHPEHQILCRQAEKAIKASLDKGIGAVLWGVDAGVHGVVYGYDDEDQVFHVSGIGTSDGQHSNPIRYVNLGNCYDQYPILFCQIPKPDRPRELSAVYLDSLRYYTQHMRTAKPYGNFSYGLEAYRTWIEALNGTYHHFGLRYLAGTYADKKLHAAEYAACMQINSKAMQSFNQAERQLANMFLTIHHEILDQDFNGWNHLHKPVSAAQAKRVQKVLVQAESMERRAIAAADQLVQDLKETT